MKYRTNKMNIVTSKDSWEKKLAHRVCLKSWMYRGKQVMTVKVKSKSDVVDA